MKKTEKPKTYNTSKVVAYIILFYGIIFTSVGIFSLFDSKNAQSSSAALGGFLFGLPTLFGGYLLWKRAYKKSKEALTQYLEEIIFGFAKSNNGRINAIEFGMEANLPKAKAEELLNDMVIKGNAITQVNDNGFVEYVFPVFLKDN